MTYLHHETNDENHRHAGHDVRVILYDELMAQNRGILVGVLSALHRDHPAGPLFILGAPDDCNNPQRRPGRRESAPGLILLKVQQQHPHSITAERKVPFEESEIANV